MRHFGDRFDRGEIGPPFGRHDGVQTARHTGHHSELLHIFAQHAENVGADHTKHINSQYAEYTFRRFNRENGQSRGEVGEKW